MKIGRKTKIATAITAVTMAASSLFIAHQKAPTTILERDTNIQYIYTDENGIQHIGVLDDTQALSANAETGAIIEKTSMFIAYGEEKPPFKRWLPAIFNGSLSWADGSRAGYYRPAPGGVSVGHANVTYGTIGDQVCYNGNCNCFITNAHVAGGLDGGKVGDPMYQPGKYHGGNDVVGHVVVMVTPLDHVTNTVDAAVVCGERGSVYPGILGGGVINGTEKVSIGMRRTKCGVTSGCTTLTVKALDVTAKVAYMSRGSRIPKVRTFAHLIMWSGKSAPGDSGSAIGETKLAALLFAGNDDGEVLSINPEYLLKAIPGLIP